jgi:hypothetical protein
VVSELTPLNVQNFVIVGNMPGVDAAHQVKYGSTFNLGSVQGLPAVIAGGNESMSLQALEAGKAILKDVEGLSNKKTDAEKSKVIEVKEDAIKKYLGTNKKRTTFIHQHCLSLVKDYVSSEWKKQAGKKQKDVDSDLAQRLSAFGNALGINQDLDTANNAIAAAAGFSPKDIKNAVQALTKAVKKPDVQKEEAPRKNGALEYAVSHPMWEKFQSCFDDNVGLNA